jgi:protein-L-isoaspartate(D-aspartate) O-methyltransferase
LILHYFGYFVYSKCIFITEIIYLKIRKYNGYIKGVMHWEYVLTDEDYSLYRRNITLLEEQVVEHFPELRNAPEILSAIRNVPRHLFVNRSYRYLAYTDNAVPTSGGLTTSAPSVIGQMIYHAGIRCGEKLLEIGTGTGYEAAVLSEMGVNVFTIEIDKYLAMWANRVLVQLGYKIDKTVQDEEEKKKILRRFQEIRKFFPNRGMVELYSGNGRFGLKRHSPFKGIIVAASVPHLKYIDHLIEQLSPESGKLVVPAGKRNDQLLYIIERKQNKFYTNIVNGISFDFVRLFLE